MTADKMADFDIRHARVGEMVPDGHGHVLTITELPWLAGNGLVRATVRYENGEEAVAWWGPRFRIPVAVDRGTR